MKVLLLYPPEQSWPDSMCKPNGSLAYPMLAGALIENGIDAYIYDACVGNEEDDLYEVFYKNSQLESGMLRTGVSTERILDIVSKYDIIGITSIFSHQETMVLHTIRLIKDRFPNKLVISGGVNARNRVDKFFDAGIDVICTSESEKTIIEICRKFESGSRDFRSISRTISRYEGAAVLSELCEDINWDLDTLPIPRWDMLPNDRYWKIGRPHGGHFKDGEELRYASLETSRGCPFACSYCHIAGELKDLIPGEIGRYRVKSDDRVIRELEILRDLNVKQIFIEDDSLLGKKKRAITLIQKIIGMKFDVLDVNGINIIHLLKKGEPDIEMLDLLQEVGFKDITLPFESANPRIIKKYCSNKWDVTNSNVTGLISEMNKRNISMGGNFMIGFPDETREEIYNTLSYAENRMIDGLNNANFFLVMPLPGTPLFDFSIKNGYLPQDYQPDRMHWQKANMINTEVPPHELEKIRDEAWHRLNQDNYVQYKKEMTVK